MTIRTAFIKHRFAGLCALTLILASPWVMAEQTGYYRWKDDKGQFQATQQPPPDRPSEYIKLSTGKSTPLAAGETVEKKENEAKPASSGGGLQGVPDKDPAKCKQAEEAQTMLEGHARIREKTDSGEYRYLSADEIAEQKRIAKESTDVYCEPPSK